MSLLLAIGLGILQGLTEFFPVSSSGHLALFGAWFGLHEPDLTFDILVHLATLAAILVYFRADWYQLAAVLFKREQPTDMPRWVLPYLLISMMPAGLVGVFYKDNIEWFHSQPQWIGLFLLVTGLILVLGLRLKQGGRPLMTLGLGVVIAMALAQAAAILPGISRSGATIMIGLFLGLERKAAARFSFLMAVPVIGGAGLLALIDLAGSSQGISAELGLAYGAGFLAALLSGFAALAFMMRLLEGNRFFFFGFYCLALGGLAISGW